VFSSIVKAGSVEKVALTSSVAAVSDDIKPEGYVYTEQDWTEGATVKLNPYALSKTLAEKEAWAIQESLPASERFNMITILPVLVSGPVYAEVHVRSSPVIFRDLMVKNFPRCPRINYGIVDVRDVAKAHVNGLENKCVSGRFILSNGEYWMQDLSKIIRKHFPNSPAPLKEFPDWAMYIFSLFDKRISFGYLKNNLRIERLYNGERVVNQMDMTYTPVEESIRETCQSFLDNGFVKL